MTDMSAKRRRRIVVLIVLFVMFGTLALGYLMTFHLDTIRRMVQQQMAQVFGPHIHIEDMRVAFFPYPRLELVHVAIRDSAHAAPMFVAEKIHVDVDVFSLFQDEIVTKNLRIHNPELFLIRDAQGVWNFHSTLETQDDGIVVGSAWLENYTLLIDGGVIHITDAFHQPTPETVKISHIEMQLEPLSVKQPMKVSLAGIVNDDSRSRISCEGVMSGVLEFFGKGKDFRSSAIGNITLQSQIDLSSSDVTRLGRLFGIANVLNFPQGRVSAQSHIHYAPGKEGYTLTLTDFVMLTDEIDVKGTVVIDGLQTGDPQTLTLTWSHSPVPIQPILRFIPRAVLPEGFQSVVEDFPIQGKIETISATISGFSGDQRGRGLTGEFVLSEGSMNFGEVWGKATDVKGSLIVHPDHLQLKNFQGLYDTIPVSARGEVTFGENGPWLVTELEGEVPAITFFHILKGVLGWTDSDHFMSTMEGKSGGGNMIVRLEGPLRQPDRLSFNYAKYEPRQVEAVFPGIRGSVQNLSGTVTYSEGKVTFSSLRGMVGRSLLELDGAITVQEVPAYESLRLTGTISSNDLAEQLSVYGIRVHDFLTGIAPMTMTLAGSLESPRIQARIDLQELEFHVQGILQKIKGVSGIFETDLGIEHGDNLTIRHMRLSFPTLTLSGKGVVPWKRDRRFWASISASPFDLQRLPPGMTLFENGLRSGRIEFAMKVEGKGKDWRLWNKQGHFLLQKGELSIDGLENPLSDVALRLRFAGHRIAVEDLLFRIQKSHARIAGLIHNWETRPQVKFEMHAPQFDLDLLVPKGERSLVRDTMEFIAATQTVMGQLSFGKAWYNDLRFKQLQARVRIKEEVVGIDNIIGTMNPGEVRGRLLIHLPQHQPASVKTWVNLNGIPLEPIETSLLSAEHLQKRLVTGKLSLEGMLQGHGRDPRGVVPTLDGQLRVTIQDGRIQRGTVIPKMLALMNLPSLLQGKIDLQKEGYPFDTQSATVTIAKGVMKSDDIVMDGPILKLSGAGTYDLPKDELHLVIAASPLGPYFDLLRKIPLFHLLLEGDQESIDMALFEVRGKIEDPTITPLPLESFKSGLTGFARLAFNVLKNTISLPKNLLFPKSSEETEPPSSNQIQKTQDDG